MSSMHVKIMFWLPISDMTNCVWFCTLPNDKLHHNLYDRLQKTVIHSHITYLISKYWVQLICNEELTSYGS